MPRDHATVGFTRFFQLAKPELPILVGGSVFLALGSGMMLLYPQAIRVLVDQVLGPRRPDLLDKAALAILVVLLVQGFAGAVRYYMFTLAGERVVARLRQAVFANLMRQDVAFFDARRTGELTSRLASDATVLQNTVSVNISMALRNAVTAVGGTALLFYTSPVLTLFMLAVIPPVAWGAAVFGRRIRRVARDVQDSLAEAGTVAEETISGLRTVRAFAQEDRETARYAQAVSLSFRNARRRIGNVAAFTGAASLLAYAAIVAMLWHGGRLVLQGDMSVGDLTSFILYTLTVSIAVGSLGSLWTDFMAAGGAAVRVFELLDRAPTIPLTGGARLPRVEGRVALENVDFSYPSRPGTQVLHGVTLALPPSSVVALVGPSGGGKSTIAALIPRFYDPDAGRVTLDGHDLRDLDAAWLRRHVGIVAQDPILMSTSIAANIRYGNADATDAEVEAAARAANAHDFIRSFPDGYGTIVGERGIQLSGGQRQRVAIARAVLKDPRILILDEATSALDTESEALVKEALARLMVGRTTLVIAHRLSTIRNADTVAVIDQGRVVQRGRHDELMADPSGLYARLVSRQILAME